MGHPPNTDGDLTLISFLNQLQQCSYFQQNKYPHYDDVLKLDFKSMAALQSNFKNVEIYINGLSSSIQHENICQQVWINADILSGPGEDPNDKTAQTRMQPKFHPEEFLQLVTMRLPGTTLSIGWTTSLADIFAMYTEEMVTEMIHQLKPYPHVKVTFPIRATSFRRSWGALQKLYRANENWTVTLWWSGTNDVLLKKEEFDWIYETLERGERGLRNRTYYDVVGFADYYRNVVQDGHVC